MAPFFTSRTWLGSQRRKRLRTGDENDPETSTAAFLTEIEDVKNLNQDAVARFQQILLALPSPIPKVDCSEAITLGKERIAFVDRVTEGRQFRLGANHRGLAKCLLLWVNHLIRDAQLGRALWASQLILDWQTDRNPRNPTGLMEDATLMRAEIYVYQRRWEDAENAVRTLRSTEIFFTGNNHKANRLIVRALVGQHRWKDAQLHLPSLHEIITPSNRPKVTDCFLFNFFTEIFIGQERWKDAIRLLQHTLQSFLNVVWDNDEQHCHLSATSLDLLDLHSLAVLLAQRTRTKEAIDLLGAVLDAGGYYRNDRLFRIIQLRSAEALSRIYIEQGLWEDAELHLEPWLDSTLDQLANDWGCPDPDALVRNVEDLANYHMKEQRWNDAISVLKGFVDVEGKLATYLGERVTECRRKLTTLYRSQGRMVEWQEMRFTLL